jgi:hypothetical protein
MIELRISNYLQSGGLFNPELMEHDKVRDLIIDCQKEITKNKGQLRTALECLVKMKGYGYDGYFPIDEALEKIEGINIVPNKV